MRVNTDFLHLINRIEEGHLYTKQECEFLLSFPETSLEAAITRGVADRLSREKFGKKDLSLDRLESRWLPARVVVVSAHFLMSSQPSRPTH